MLAIGLVLVLSGASFLYFGFYGQEIGTAATSVSSYPDDVHHNPDTGAQDEASMPVSLTIPDADIEISVLPGYYNERSKQWTLTNNNAHFAMMSKMPNGISGNTFIYGHNRSSVFSRLANVTSGSKVYITTESGQTYIYEYRERYSTDPNDQTVLYFDGPARLTLQTCSGAFFQNRTLYIFDLVGKNHA